MCQNKCKDSQSGIKRYILPIRQKTGLSGHQSGILISWGRASLCENLPELPPKEWVIVLKQYSFQIIDHKSCIGDKYVILSRNLCKGKKQFFCVVFHTNISMPRFPNDL